MSFLKQFAQSSGNALLQTDAHRFVVTTAGVLVYPATCEEEMEQLVQADALSLQFKELLAISDLIQTHRADWIQAQQEVEATWRAVADEVLDQLALRIPGRVHEATGEDIQRVLADLGPLTFHHILPTESHAGPWYQALWLPDERATFLQEWVPFLRLFHQRRLERFPDSDDSVEEEDQPQE